MRRLRQSVRKSHDITVQVPDATADICMYARAQSSSRLCAHAMQCNAIQFCYASQCETSSSPRHVLCPIICIDRFCSCTSLQLFLQCCRLLAHTMLWTDERLQQVIAQYTPELYLHEDERYLPCSVDWYIQRSQLWLEEPLEHVSKPHFLCRVAVILRLLLYTLITYLGFAQCMQSVQVVGCCASLCCCTASNLLMTATALTPWRLRRVCCVMRNAYTVSIPTTFC